LCCSLCSPLSVGDFSSTSTTTDGKRTDMIRRMFVSA
jgi:hypothetical protein